MKTLGPAETAALLPYSPLAEAIRDVLEDVAAGNAHAPVRTSVPLSDSAALLVMPAADKHIAITKLVTVHPSNSGTARPVVQADVLVIDAVTGKRLFMLDGATVTARRTAALSLLAARLLAPRTGGALLVVGAGVQARAHVEAFVEGLGVSQVYIASRSATRAERLAVYVREIGASAEVLPDAARVLQKASFIVTATTATEPVLPPDADRGSFIAAVGAYTPEMAELPPELVRRAAIYVDTLEGCRAEAGDLIRADVDWSRVTALVDALGVAGPSDGPVVFKSVGSALWDLAAARLASQPGSPACIE